jgi:hypothetical protein
VTLEIADLAQVDDIELFCDALCDYVEKVWRQDRRAVSLKPPSRALARAADAARTLNDAVCSLPKEDRAWVDHLVAEHPYLFDKKRLRGSTSTSSRSILEAPFQRDELAQTVWLLTLLFDISVGRLSPLVHTRAAPRNKRGRRKGAVKDLNFEQFIRDILTCTAVAEGELTLDKNFNRGTLLDALNILRSYLPKGLMPNVLPLGTIQKIKTRHAKSMRAIWLKPPSR